MKVLAPLNTYTVDHEFESERFVNRRHKCYYSAYKVKFSVVLFFFFNETRLIALASVIKTSMTYYFFTLYNNAKRCCSVLS